MLSTSIWASQGILKDTYSFVELFTTNDITPLILPMIKLLARDPQSLISQNETGMIHNPPENDKFDGKF